MTQSKALKSVALVTTTAAATLMLIQACGGGAVAQTAEIDPMVGVWDATVSIKDCASGAVLSTFKGQSVTHHGGTFSADNSRPPTTRGAAFGTWKRNANGTYLINLVFMRFAPDMSLAGTSKSTLTRTLSADGNSFTSEIAGKVIDTAGVVVQQTCASEVGQRVTW